MSNRLDTDLATERHERIAQILGGSRVSRVNELRDALGVSPATVRRDLEQMEQQGRLRRVHGGAVAVQSRMEEPLFDDKAAIAAKQKAAIAKAALSFVKDNDSIFLDGGSTVLALARLVADRKNLTVVTNSLRVATALSGGGPRLFIVGGEFRPLSQVFVGPLTRPLLEQLRVDVAFMGTIGLSDTDGITTTDPREAFTKELVMAHAEKVALLADSTKIGKVSFVRFGSLADVEVLVTDRGASEKDVRSIRKQTKVVRG